MRKSERTWQMPNRAERESAVPEPEQSELQRKNNDLRRLLSALSEANETLRASEEKYRTILSSIREGLTIIDVLFNEQGQAQDAIILDANPAQLRREGQSHIIGRKLREAYPGIEEKWIRRYAEVARTGRAADFEDWSARNQRYYKVHAARVGGAGSSIVAIIYSDETERRNIEQLLKESESQKSILLRVSDAVRPLTDQKSIQAATAQIALEHFQADRCIYAEIKDGQALIRQDALQKGLQPIAGKYFLQDFPLLNQSLENHQHLMIDDIRNCAEMSEQLKAICIDLKIIALLIVAVFKNGTPIGLLGISQSTPRHWLKSDADLGRETAERASWAMKNARNLAAIRKSEEKYRALFDSIHEGYALLEISTEGDETRFVHLEANPVYEWLLGQSPTGKTVGNLFGYAEDGYWGACALVAGTGVPVTVEQYYQPGDRWLRITISRVGSTHSQLAVVLSDLTEKRRAEERLRIWEERYRTALEAAEMGAWDWNVPGDQVVCNDHNFILLGLRPGNQPNSMSYFLQFVHEDDHPRVRKALYDAAANGGTFNQEYRILRASNDAVHWMHSFGRVIELDEYRAGVRMIGVTYDITGRKRTEQQKDEFLSIASHELKTPVASIKSYAEILEEEFNDRNDTQSAALMHRMDRQIDRLAGLIDTLLDVTRISEGRMELNKRMFDIRELAEELIEDLQPTTRHSLQIKHSPLSPVWADRERILQVLRNLLSNAIKYTPDSGRIRVSIRPDDSGGTRVCVKDTGIGMDPETARRVFERFYRAENALASTYPGLGLGLYISAEIISQHGGLITVDSAPGRGSEFCFTLPPARPGQAMT